MDPLSTLGLASKLLQIPHFSPKLVFEAKEIYASASGTIAELEDSERATAHIRSLARRLVVSTAVESVTDH